VRAIHREGKRYTREVAWDIEATEWANVLCVCGVSSDGGRIRAPSIHAYLKAAQEKGWLSNGTRHWAHGGGVYDHLLLLESALHRWKLVKASGAWNVDLRRGESVIHCRDSLRLFDCSLSEVGETFGLRKAEGIDRRRLIDYPRHVVMDYCERDCEVLLHAILSVQRTVDGLGMTLGDTVASTAARFVRSRLPADVFRWSADQDAIATRAYYGGRVERFRDLMGMGRTYDIHSCYPSIMA